MSLDYPDRKRWLAIRATPANLYRKLGRLLFAGTYVRARGDAKADARLAWYQGQCNGNARKQKRRRVSGHELPSR